MEKTIKKRIKNLLTRIGDEGSQYYSRDIEKLNNLTPTFLNEEDKRRYFLDQFRICLNKIPFKSFVYAIYFTNQLQNYEKYMENIIDDLFEDLQHTLNIKKKIEAENIMLFFGELVKVGVMNSFTYISLLMDLVSSSEKFPSNFSFLINIVLKSITLVQEYLIEKFEMEFKNLIEDLERIFSSFLMKGFLTENSWEWKFFLAVKNKNKVNSNFFQLNCKECLNSIKHVKNLRKNFKLKMEIINIGQNPTEEFMFNIQRIPFFEPLIKSKLENLNGLNEFIIYDFLWKNFLAFHKNIILFLEKIFVIKFEEMNSLKDFLLLELIFTLLIFSYKLENKLLPALIIEKLILYFNYDVFLGDSWKNFKAYFFENFHFFSIEQIISIVKNINMVNFLTNYNVFNLDPINININMDLNLKEFTLNYYKFENNIYFINEENFNDSQIKVFEQFQDISYEFKSEHQYILQFLKSNHSANYFFDFLKDIMFCDKQNKQMGLVFLRAFLEQASLSYTHFKNYYENYKDILEYFFITKERLFLEIYFELIDTKTLFFIKAICFVFFTSNFEKANILNYLISNLFQDDRDKSRAIFEILNDIRNESLLLKSDSNQQIIDLLKRKYAMVDQDNMLWQKFVLSFEGN